MISAGQNLAADAGGSDAASSRIVRSCLLLCGAVGAMSLLLTLFLHKGYPLAVLSDGIQTALIAAATALSFRNLVRTHSNIRVFWFLIFVGNLMWLASMLIWSAYEVVLRRSVPDIPFGDILIFLKLVPLSAALALRPHKPYHSRFQAFGLLDVSIFVIYFLYLYTFWVYAYRLVPDAGHVYDFRFNVADAIGNQLFALMTGIAFLQARGAWRSLYGLYFVSAATYCVASDLSNVAIDLGQYYSGNLLDVFLTLSLAALLAFTWEGGRLPAAGQASETSPAVHESTSRPSFLSSYFAMIVTLSTPAIGLWLLSHDSSAARIYPFRLAVTLLTIFLLTLLLALKQHLLTESLVGSLQSLSDTYASINRFKDQLTQNEKLASLGESVAQVANQIKNAMAVIREKTQLLTARPDSDSRIQSMAGKIGQYAHRTDTLVENMLRFAQETSLQPVPLEIKPLIESALQLGRTSKRANLQVTLIQAGEVPLVLGDSSQLLHVFLQIISNAVDAIEEKGGGALDISITASGSQVRLEFSDSGPGIKEPEHVFEPFYTTKPVGKGIGLGLSTCYGIIQKHQGEISCHNRAQGGAVFTVLLPSTVKASRSPLELPSPVVEDVR